MTDEPKYRLQGLARSAMARALGFFFVLLAALSFIAAALGKATIANLLGAAIFGVGGYLLLKAADSIRASSIID
jgi:hypothetical protein